MTDQELDKLIHEANCRVQWQVEVAAAAAKGMIAGRIIRMQLLLQQKDRDMWKRYIDPRLNHTDGFLKAAEALRRLGLALQNHLK